MRRLTLAVAGLSLLALSTPLRAQEATEAQAAPETRILTITAFHVPFGAKMAAFMNFANEYIVPSSNEDPHVLMYRIATHYWGTTDATVWLVTEYASLAEMEASGDWQEEWYEEHYPEGTPEREAADEAFQKVFIPFFAHHTDQILNVDMSRAK